MQDGVDFVALGAQREPDLLTVILMYPQHAIDSLLVIIIQAGCIGRDMCINLCLLTPTVSSHPLF